MAKTLILGNNPYIEWVKAEDRIPIIQVPNIPSNNALALAEFVSALPCDIDCILIDVDSLNAENTELPLSIALYIRLMLERCLKTSLCHISLVTELDIEIFKGYGALSMLLMTQKIDLIKSAEVSSVLRICSPLTPSEYVNGFINLIKIEPQEKVEGRHSIANEWGAYILAQSISAGEQHVTPRPSRSSEYFLYSSIVALDAEDVNRIINQETSLNFQNKIQVKKQFTYLLIDDEADKGWTETLKLLMPDAKDYVWNERITEYNNLGANIRKEIEGCKFDIIFLDLRMNGVSEEKYTEANSFSGMKILRSIKSINPGIQVIMLTATNKSWNVKALLDAGADGYYMKESPEYHFAISYTEQNTKALKEEIERCVNRSYLKDIYRNITRIDLNSYNGLEKSLDSQLRISFDIIRKANSQTDIAYAYIALEQVFELAANHLYNEEYVNGEWKCIIEKESKIMECNSSTLRRKFNINYHPSPKTPLWLKVAVIYYVLFDGNNKDFLEHIKEDINLRNDYIHKNAKPQITSDDYQNLFDSVIEFLSVFD